jgi:dTDP-4-amino-4,6-dideoxygalactose transaminase
MIARKPDQAEVRAGLDFSRTETLRYQRPELPPLHDVARYYALSEDARFYSNGGPCAQRLTARLSDYVGGAGCVLVGNCTLGLMAALRALCGEPAPGRALIAVPSFTFTATACAIRWAGFEPLFVDIEPESWLLDPIALEAALDARPVAGVLACSTFGTAPHASLRAGWRAACARAGVPLLIDSAAGFGAVDEAGLPLGSQGDTEVFSFHATKPFAIGEGGAVVSSDAEIVERIERIINFGIDPDSRLSLDAGLNAKMSEIQAAIGLAMLDRFDGVLARRRATAARLKALVARHPLTYQAGSAGSTWQVFQLLVPDADTRARAVALAEPHRIECRTMFEPPLHRHPAFASATLAGPLATTEAVAARTLSLPLANSLGPRQLRRLTDFVDASLEDHRC